MSDTLTAELPPEMRSVLDSILEPDTSLPADPGMKAIDPNADAPKDTEPRLEKKEEPKKEAPPEHKKEEPVKLEKEVSQPAEDDDTPPENLPNDGRKEVWKKFRDSYGAKKKELQDVKQQLAEFEGTKKERDTLKSEMDGLKKQVEELGKIDSLSKLENHPDFKRKYDEARSAHVDKLKNLSELADIKPDELLSALSKAPKEKYRELDDILSGAPSALKTKILSAIDAIETIDEGRKAELATAQQSLSRLEQDRLAKQKEYSQQEEKHRELAFEAIATKMAKDLGLSPEKTAEAKKFFMSNEDLQEAARVVLEAQTAKEARDSKAALQKELDEAKKALSEYRGSSPSLSSGTGNEGGSDGPRKDEDYAAYILRKAREASGR